MANFTFSQFKVLKQPVNNIIDSLFLTHDLFRLLVDVRFESTLYFLFLSNHFAVLHLLLYNFLQSKVEWGQIEFLFVHESEIGKLFTDDL